MNFKDLLKEDQKVFFNAEEMGDTLKVEGQNIVCFLDDDKFEKNNNEFGSFKENKILIIQESDYELIGKPQINEEIKIGISKFKIKSVQLKKGVIELKLEGNRS